jgi:hypothetical protein
VRVNWSTSAVALGMNENENETMKEYWNLISLAKGCTFRNALRPILAMAVVMT